MTQREFLDIVFALVPKEANTIMDAFDEYVESAQPAQHIDADGTLWITVTDIEQVKRVIVDEDKSKFCRQFYMDAKPEQRAGKWIDDGSELGCQCSECGKSLDEYIHATECMTLIEIPKFCPNCGAKMDEDRDYEHAVEQLEHNMTFEPTYNPEDDSM